MKDNERSFRLLVEGVLDYAIYMLDPRGLVTTWNAGAERMKGYSSAEVIGRHFSDFYTPEDRASGFPAKVLETAAREGRYEAEGWRVRKDGSRFWASVVVDAIHDTDGSLIGFAKITRDITERRIAQDTLRESERQFRLLVNGVTDYALFMLDPDGVVTSWNAGAERIKGYASHEIIGEHFSRFYTEEDRAAGKPALSLEVAAKQGRSEMEAWRVRKDGSLFWANVVLDPIRDESGRLLGFAKITRDITERRRAELALQAAQAQRDRAQRMEALGQLTGGVAHDFNNLLMIISGQARALRKVAQGDDRAARAVEAIEIAAKRGASLTRQLLTFSRRQSLNPEVVDLRDRMANFSELVSGSLGSSIALKVETAEDLWPVSIDVNELELALINLTVNARDAIVDAGTVTLSAKNVELTPNDGPTGLEGPFVAVTVRDTGGGIPPDVLPRVFDPFFTTKAAGKGSGLGLSQVHGFAHQSGGSVLIESALGQGTSVTIYLPRSDEPVREETGEKQAEISHTGELLLVEDNPEVAEASRAIFEQLGYRVQVAPDAESALGRLERKLPELVVSDIVMPGRFDGLALARTIRERHPQTPILLVTGYSNAANSADREFVVLRKPYSAAEFSRAASKVMAERQQRSRHQDSR